MMKRIRWFPLLETLTIAWCVIAILAFILLGHSASPNLSASPKILAAALTAALTFYITARLTFVQRAFMLAFPAVLVVTYLLVAAVLRYCGHPL
jgi:hypothetical protein